MADIAMASPLTSEAVQPLREQVRGRVITAADEGYDEARMVHNGMFDRRPLAVLKAEQVGDVIACRELRPRARARSVRARRRAQRARIRDERRGPGHRHVGDAHGTCGSEEQDGSCRCRRDVGRLQLRNPRLWPGDDRRDHLDHGHLRSHAGRRHRLPGPRARADDRQPDLGRRGHRGREVPHRERARERGSLLGAAGRGWQLRRRDLARVSPRRGRPGLRRADLLQPGGRRHRASNVRRVHPGRARGVRRFPRVPDRPAAAVHPRGPARRHRCAWSWCTGPARSTRPRKS